MTDTSDLMNALTGENKRPIWPVAAPAIVISALWASLSSASMAREDPPAADLDAVRVVGEAAYAMGAAVVPAVVVWAAFQIFAFHRRAFSKSLWVLALMIAFSFMLAFPARLAAVGGGAARWSAETHERFQARFVAFAEAAPPREVLAAVFEPTPDIVAVNARLQQVQQFEATARDYLVWLDAETARARTSLAHLALSDRTRAERSAWLGTEVGETAQLRQMPKLILRMLEKREQILLLLRAHPEAWTLRDGQIVVFDAALLNQLRAFNAELSVAYAEFRSVIDAPTTATPAPEERSGTAAPWREP